MPRQPSYGYYGEAPQIWKYGCELMRTDQGEALLRWDSLRYTVERLPDWARAHIAGKNECPPQFLDDADWLEHTEFVVTMAGKLDLRVKRCREHPTWPLNPELRNADPDTWLRYAPNLRGPGWNKRHNAITRVEQMEFDRQRAGQPKPLPDLQPVGTDDEAVLAAMRERGLLVPKDET